MTWPSTEQLKPEQTATEYLKSTTDISKPAVDFLNKLEKTDWYKEQADLLKKNENIISGMENMFKSKIDGIVNKGEKIDDDEAKMIITYDALKDRYLDRTIPNNETERKIVALRIVDQLTNIKNFEAHTKVDRYYNFKTETYSDIPNENTLDLNLDVISLDTWNTAINSFLAKNSGIQESLLQNKKNSRLSDIMFVTWWNDEKNEDQNSPSRLLHKQAQAKLENSRQEYRPNNTREKIKEFKNNPDKCMELVNLFTANKEAFNTPANEDMVNLKDMFMDIITDSYVTRKESNWLYTSREDLRRDDGFRRERDDNGNKINLRKEAEGLDKNNISLVVDDKNISIKNNITQTSLSLTKDTFEKWRENRQEIEKNRELTREYRQKFEKKYMKDNGLTNESIRNMTDKEQHKTEQDMQIAMITEVFTKDENMYNIFISETERDQNWAESLRGEWMGKAFNAILTKLNKGELEGFDCTTWRTTREIKDEKWQKYIELRQGKSLVKLWFNKILEKTIDARSPEEKQKDEAGEQDKLLTDSKNISIDTYEPSNRVPDLHRAFDKIENPREWNSVRYVDLTDLNLTDKDVAFLSTKLSDLKDKGWKYAINLGNNNIEHVSKSLFTIEHITGIDLTNNNLESLPKLEQRDGTTEHITSLDVSSNSFDYFPEVTQFKNLQSLDISWNNISNINDTLKLSNLTDLQADNLKLEKIPEWLQDKTWLQILSLADNKLTTKIDVSKLTKLKSLCLDGNKEMTDFPTMGKNDNITNIDCRHTHINTIPTNIKDNCPNIKNIDIYDNIFSEKDAINNFLDWSLTNNWYEFKKNWQKEKELSMKEFFHSSSKFKYTETFADSESEAVKQAKHDLWLHDQTDTPPYAIKTTTWGKVSIYMFASAEKNKDWL